MNAPNAPPQLPEPAIGAALPSEITTRERRGFIFLLGAANLVFLGLDLRSSWPSAALVTSGRIVLSTALLAVAFVLREGSNEVAARRVVRALALGAALAFGAIVWGTGGTAGPYAAFFGVLPIVFTLAVPDDLVATLVFSTVCGAIGVARATVEGLAPSQIAFWCLAHASSGGYAVASSVLHGRLRLRERRAERAARAAAEYQAMLLENLHDAVIGMDASFRINAWNRTAERLFGFGRQEAMGRDVHELIPSRYADGSSMAEILERARAGRVQMEVQRRSRGGEWLSLESTTVALRGSDGEVLGYLSVNRDISVRKRAEAALRTSQQRLQRILETSNDGIWIMDAEGRTEYANARAAELFGFQAEEMLGRPFVAALPESLRSDAAGELDAISRGEPRQVEITLRRPDGTDAWLVLSRSALRDSDGRVTGAVSVFLDVTATRRALGELQQAQKLEAVGHLAAGIAHEINTPIQFIGDNTHFLGEAFTALAALHQRCRGTLAQRCSKEATAELEQAERDLDVAYLLEETPKTIARSLEGVRRVSTIVRAMKEFAHPDQNERVSVDLNHSLQATLEVARSEYKYVADIETDFGEIPAVPCVAGDLNQVFLNIIVNAAHGIESAVSGTHKRGTIRVTTRRDGVEVVVAIADTGCGIPEAIRDKVFDPFFTTKPVGRGTGQGLAIARSIVKKHGGHLSFTSKVGAGTTFSIRLPLDVGKAPRDSAA